ncbi:MAG: hypothetical protein LM583_11050, partial [Desulfurococcaceae archaeon]|nr:hypothetical protein [Desulfurococcaceae archaeon]
VGEASESTPRPNPANGNTAIYRYHQVPLAEKHYKGEPITMGFFEYLLCIHITLLCLNSSKVSRSRMQARWKIIVASMESIRFLKLI